MITDALISMIQSWVIGLASILPTVSFQEAPYGQSGDGNWLGSVFSHLAYAQQWGVPVGTIMQIVSVAITLEIAYGSVLLIVFVYNRIRGA